VANHPLKGKRNKPKQEPYKIVSNPEMRPGMCQKLQIEGEINVMQD